MLFAELQIFYNFTGEVSGKEAEIYAFGLNDSMGFKINFINENKAELSFYPPQKTDTFLLYEDFKNSCEIEYFAVDTSIVVEVDSEKCYYDLLFHKVFFNHSEIEFINEDVFGEDLKQISSEFYKEILPTETENFTDFVQDFAISWYYSEYHEVLFNDYGILIIGKYNGGYTVVASTWNEEDIIIIDIEREKELTFNDIFDIEKQDEFLSIYQ